MTDKKKEGVVQGEEPDDFLLVGIVVATIITVIFAVYVLNPMIKFYDLSVWWMIGLNILVWLQGVGLISSMLRGHRKLRE